MEMENDKMTPNNIKIYNNPIIKTYAHNDLDNMFAIFNSINYILCIVFTNNKKSIISYNLIENKKIIEIKKAHGSAILSLKYYLDKINKRDLIISSADNVKIWNANKWECLFQCQNNACCLIDNKELLFASYIDENFIKVFDINGDVKKEMLSDGTNPNLIDSYYDNKYYKNYIIVCFKNSIESYDYLYSKLFKKYTDENDIIYMRSFLITDDYEQLKLIGASWINDIRIWNFHSGELLSKIRVSIYHLSGLCLWNTRYLFVGCEDKKISLIDLKSYKIINEFNNHKDYIITIKKIIHPQFGECLLTQGYIIGDIYLWTIIE